MTGGEIAAGVAAAKAVGKAVEKATEDDADERKQVLELAKDRPAMVAAADARARRIAVREQIRLKLIEPFARLLGVSKEYFEDQFEADLNEHLKDVPDENLKEPSGQLLGAAMQGLAFTQGEPDLREMYLRLLVAASDDRRAGDAHPSFAQIIRELSSDEAGLLKWCLACRQLPIARIKLVTGGNTWNPLRHNVLHWPDTTERTADELALRSIWVDNWERLRLVNVSYAEHIAYSNPPPSAALPDPYAWVEQTPGYPVLPSTLDENGNPEPFPHVSFDRGLLRTTDFGWRFFTAVS